MIQNLLYLFGFFFIIQTLKMISELIVLATGKKAPAVNAKDGVSVIVCAKNEREKLPKIIDSLLDQDYEDKEIIVVDDRSTDGSYEVLLDYGEKIHHVRIDQTPDHINNKKYAITLGVKAAKNEKLLFIDADCYPKTNNWISTMMQYHNKGFVLGFSQYLKKPGLLNKFIRFETMISGIQFLALAKIGNPYMGVGRNMGYFKSIFIDNKGFYGYNDVIGGDDDLFVNKHASRKNTNAVLNPDGLVYSHPKENLKDYFRQKKRHIAVSKRYKVWDKFILGLFTLSQLGYWVLLIMLISLHLDPKIWIAAHLIRTLVLTINMYLASLRLGDRINLLVIPLLDLCHTFYLVIVGSTAMFAKKITWN